MTSPGGASGITRPAYSVTGTDGSPAAMASLTQDAVIAQKKAELGSSDSYGGARGNLLDWIVDLAIQWIDSMIAELLWMLDDLDFLGIFNFGSLARQFDTTKTTANNAQSTATTADTKATDAKAAADAAAAQAIAASAAVFDLSEVAVTSITTPIWAGTSGLDIVSFPRFACQVTSGFISRFSPSSGTLMLIYIRSDRKADFTKLKAIFMGVASGSRPTSTLIGVYGVDPTTNTFSKLWDSGNMEGTGTLPSSGDAELSIDMGTVISAEPGHLLAVAILETYTSGKVRPYAANAAPPVTQPGIWPPASGAYMSSPQTVLPSTFNMSATTAYGASIIWCGLSQ